MEKLKVLGKGFNEVFQREHRSYESKKKAINDSYNKSCRADTGSQHRSKK